jgi:hypothetical protein
VTYLEGGARYFKIWIQKLAEDIRATPIRKIHRCSSETSAWIETLQPISPITL